MGSVDSETVRLSPWRDAPDTRSVSPGVVAIPLNDDNGVDVSTMR